jgi:hypothetical protein
VTIDDARDYLYDFNQVGNTDIYSDQKVLDVVEYFENNVIDMLDSTLSNTIPFKFVYYFRSYEYHAFYQSTITLSEDYIDTLFDALPSLYNKPEYWSSDYQVAYFRWFAAMLMDIDGHRGEMYDYIKLHMNTNSSSFLSQGSRQADGMNAVTFIIWRGLSNGDATLHQAMTTDTTFLDDYLTVINNSYLLTNYEQIALNYIGLIYQLISESYNANDLTLDIPAFEAALVTYESNTTFGTYVHMKLITQLYKADSFLADDWSSWRKTYFEWEFPDVKEYDNGEIVFNTNMTTERRNGLYLAIKEAKANFFKLMGDTNPIPGDTNDTINIYLYRSYDHYQHLSELIAGFSAIGGGVYIEEHSSLYTFDREDTMLPIEHLVKHEYVHYIDARHNIHGNFGEFEFYDWQTGRYSFWNEGLAEFIASTPRSDKFYMTKYAAEVVWNDVISNSPSPMNLYQATHNPISNGNRTYAYANAAWSFLYTHHHEDLLELIKSVRENRTSDFQTYLDSISSISSYGAQFEVHLDSIATDFANTFNLQGQNGNAGNYYGFNPPMPEYNYEHSNKVDIDVIQQVIDSINIISSYTIHESYSTPSWVRIEIDTVLTNVNTSSAMKLMATHINQKINEFEDLGDVFTGFNFVNGWMDSITESNNSVQLKIVYEFPRFGEYAAPSDPILSVLEPPVTPIKITAYPNPFTDVININNVDANSIITIHDFNGRVVYNQQVYELTGRPVYSQEMVENQTTHRINLGFLNTGIYILTVRNKNMSSSFKIIKR